MSKSNESPRKKFFNRELSWLEFNDRVLDEAYNNGGNPILERVKFLSIVSSNLDEFFMVRLASLQNQRMAEYKNKDISGRSPSEQVELITKRVHGMVTDQYNCFNRSLVPALKKEGIVFLKTCDLSERQKEFIEEYYNRTVYPVLTPMVVDKSRPFPLVLNKSLNIAILLNSGNSDEDVLFGIVQVPSVLGGRLIEIPSEGSERCLVFLEDIIKLYIHTLFNGHEVLKMACFRVTRDTNQGLDEEEVEDLLMAIQEFIKKRKWGMAIRLELEQGADNGIIEFLKELEVPSEFRFDIKGPLDLTFLMKLSSIQGFDHLRFPPYYPQPVRELAGHDDMFKAISEGDILLHHPFQSFDPVVEFVKQASEDPRVLAIKQTLYRVSGKSPIVEALAQAAENGKQVTVLVELKARFDEQNNINWAKRLEMAGCHVIYGLVGLKTHCKVLLVVRMEDDGIKRYVHLSTGNYNDITAKIYTDIGLFTANPYFGADASALFNMLSGYSRITRMYKFDIAPVTLRDKFLRLIKHETENALSGKKAHIIAKINSLVDEGIIKALYDASNAGVEIQLIIRGICCIKPGIKGLSERISVRSIVGRYLEHSRIFYFYNNGEELIFLSSSDWMTRNLDRRVELLFPIEDPKIFERIKEILNICLRDTTNARILDGEGVYSKVDKRGKEMVNSQQYFSSQAVAKWQETTKGIVEEGFRPNQ